MKITAWKCPDTGLLFEDQKRFNAHRRILLEEQRKRNAAAQLAADNHQWWVDNFWNKACSVEHIRKLILKHKDKFAENAIKNYREPKLKGSPRIVDIVFERVKYNDSVSNTHSCPHNGVTNWGGSKDAPRGYPGFTLNLDYSVEALGSESGQYPGSSSMWENTRIHTGSGGGGGFIVHKGSSPRAGVQTFRYSVNIFLDDFPKMKEEIEKAKVWHKLSQPANMEFDVDEAMAKMKDKK